MCVHLHRPPPARSIAAEMDQLLDLGGRLVHPSIRPSNDLLLSSGFFLGQWNSNSKGESLSAPSALSRQVSSVA